jgi:EthD domain-containing protein
MFKQVVFFKKRPDRSMEEFIDYYENMHSKLAQRLGLSTSLPNAQRYVRRYLTIEPNPLTGELLDPGYQCIMEIWWNNREDYEAAMKGLSADPEILKLRLEDERMLFASNSNPVCSVVEYDSAVGPNNEIPQWVRADS